MLDVSQNMSEYLKTGVSIAQDVQAPHRAGRPRAAIAQDVQAPHRAGRPRAAGNRRIEIRRK